MSVSNGQIANQTTFNNAFLSRTTDSDTVAVVGLNNTLPASGNPITNTQQYQNEIADSDGTVGTGDATRKTYSSNNVVADGDNRKVAIGKLDGTFDGSTGHAHTGAAGQGPLIDAANLANINNFYSSRETFSITGAVGVDDDVSTQLTGATPGGGAATLGVVTTAPYNKCELRDSSTLTYIEDPSDGNRVYARLTESTGVWTLSYYTNVAGVETVYSMPSTNIDVFYVEVFDQSTRPTFGADAGYIPSLDLTADIVDATTTQPGKVNVTAQSFGGLKSFADGASVSTELSLPRTDIAGAASVIAQVYAPYANITGATATTIRGIASGADGKIIIIHNSTTSVMSITNEDGAASAANRIHLPAGTALSIGIDESVEFIYDSSLSRWVLKSGSGSGSGSGGGINFLTLDSSWQPTKQDNFNVEATIGDWETFNNASAAGTIAQDLTAYNTGFGILSTLDLIGQKFLALISGTTDTVKFQLNNPGATMVGNIFCKIYDDAAGLPGTLLATSDAFDASTITASVADALFTFTTPASLGSGLTFHAILDFSGVTFTGNFNVVGNTTDPYAGGNVISSNDGGSTYSAISGSDLTFDVQSTGAVLDLTLTGGSSSLTLSRTTTGGEILNGSASIKIVKGAIDAENQGLSCVAYIPLGYRGINASFNFPFKIISGSLVGGDLKVAAYDVTNSALIPVINDVLFSTGVMQGFLNIPSTCQQIRFGIYFASTSASAVTFSIDDVVLGPQELVLGATMTDTRSDVLLIPDSLSWGAVSQEQYFTYSSGDRFKGQCNFMAGTTTANPGYVSLPSGYLIDQNKLNTNYANQSAVGVWNPLGAGAAANLSAAGGFGIVFFNGTDTDKLYFGYQAGSNGFVANNGVNILNSGDSIAFNFDIPLQGASSNLITQNTGPFSIAQLLEFGTRVTGTPPTKLGEYQSFLRNAGTQVYTETNGDPSSPPSLADGIKIWHASSYAGGDANNEPSKYIIFAGKNKKIKRNSYLTAGRTGFLDVSLHNYSSTHAGGIVEDYDPTTGNITLFCNTFGGVANQYVGIDDANSPITGSPGFIDYDVSESIVPVQSVINPIQVTASSGSFTSTAGSDTDVTNLTLDVNCINGLPVNIWLQSDGVGDSILGCGGGLASFQYIYMRLYRNATVIASQVIEIATTAFGSYTYVPSSSFRHTDINPPAGLNTYKITMAAVSTTGVVDSTVMCARIG